MFTPPIIPKRKRIKPLKIHLSLLNIFASKFCLIVFSHCVPQQESQKPNAHPWNHVAAWSCDVHWVAPILRAASSVQSRSRSLRCFRRYASLPMPLDVCVLLPRTDKYRNKVLSKFCSHIFVFNYILGIILAINTSNFTCWYPPESKCLINNKIIKY